MSKIFIEMPSNTYATNTFFTERSLEKLSSLGEVTRNPYDRHLTIDELIEMAQDAEVIVGGWGTPKLDLEHYKKLPNLKLYMYTAGSIAPVISADLAETDLRIIGGNNVFAKSVAEGALAYMLVSLRNIEEYLGVMRDGGWKNEDYFNRGLLGKKVGIVGFGTISKYLMDALKWFGCEILIYSGYITDEDAAKYNGRVATLEEIFSTCDIVSLHSTLTERTTGMITRELLSMLKPDALFVNTARGQIVDEEALFEFLVDERFFAALDVYNGMPQADHPVRKKKNVFMMPHMAGPTIDARELVTLELCDDLARWQKGEKLQHEFFAANVSRMTQAPKKKS